jgi:hypothetical protein
MLFGFLLDFEPPLPQKWWELFNYWEFSLILNELLDNQQGKLSKLENQTTQQCKWVEFFYSSN